MIFDGDSLYSSSNLRLMESLENNDFESKCAKPEQFYLQDFLDESQLKLDISKCNVLVDMFGTTEANFIVKVCCKQIIRLLESDSEITETLKLILYLSKWNSNTAAIVWNIMFVDHSFDSNALSRDF